MDVSLNLYDLSQGLARSMSQQLLGIQLEGIWHSGIVVFGREFFFGGGIFSDGPERTPYGNPDKRLQLGTTHKTAAEFEAFLDSIRPRFRMEDYNLLSHNCNNFTDECAKFLTNSGIPQDIIDLPSRALSTPFGQMLRPQIEQYQQSVTQQYAGIDAYISAPLSTAHPHQMLLVPLFKLGTPIAHTGGVLIKAVERLGTILRASGHSQLLTDSIQSLSLLSSASAISQNENILKISSDLLIALKSLPEENRYPVLDMLRVVCLHSEGLNSILSDLDFLLNSILEIRSKLSQIAAQRLLQNLLIRSSIVSAPSDVIFGRLIVSGLNSAEINVRKGATFAAYNFALALTAMTGEDEAAVILVAGLAQYLKTQNDSKDSYEFLSAILATGSLLFCHSVLVAEFRKIFGTDLTLLKSETNQNVNMALSQLQLLLEM